MKIILSRKNEWMNRMRPFKILVDGEQIGTISNGKVEEFEIASVSRTLECKVDWCFSNKYELQSTNNNIIYLQVKNGMKAFWLMYVAFSLFLLGSFLMPTFWKNLGETGAWIRRGIFLVPLLYFGYYLTIGRRQYLKIEKDSSNIFAS